MPNYVYIATSLDGFIAERDGGIEWLTGLPDPEGGDFGFAEFMAGVDAVVMGRATFEAVVGSGVWPYEKPVFVLSTTLDDVPADFADKAEILRGDPRSIVAALRERGLDDLYVDGGRTIQGFLAADLIDELIITTAAILLGDGIPLFGRIGRALAFRAVSATMLSPNLTQSRYVRDRASERPA